MTRRAAISHRNHSFDLLRILFAACVLLAHAAELSDGNRTRELMSRLTTIHFTFGILGVDGFFLLSGYLIVKSWTSRPNLRDYLTKRALRIAPGYVVAMLVAGAVVGCLAPMESLFGAPGRHVLGTISLLTNPSGTKAYPGNWYHVLNGSVWTIPYEFRCYLLVAIMGAAGWLRKPAVWVAMTIAVCLRWSNVGFLWHLTWPAQLNGLIGNPIAMARFLAIFGIGGCFFLCRHHIRFRAAYALACAAGLTLTWLLLPQFAEVAWISFGAFLLFYLGSKNAPWLEWMSNIPDLSYGIYLYGWPVESLLIYFFHPSPWLVFGVSLLLCSGLALLSWNFVEKPALNLGRQMISNKPVPVLVAS